MGASAPPSNGRRRAEVVRPPGVSRREFLSVGVAVGGGLLLGFDLPAPPPSAFEPNAFIRVDRDGRVTLIMHKVEMGQGTYTSMSKIGRASCRERVERMRVRETRKKKKTYIRE